MKKRDENAMLALILEVAKNHENIRAVVMNGSRASPFATKDTFQDFDILYIVNDVSPFVEDQAWLKIFGDRIIMQTPDEIDGAWPHAKDRFAFLMLFEDGNRIDLTLMQSKKYRMSPRDSQSILLLDKDLNLDKFDEPSDKDYLIKKPSEKEFMDCCNEFFWVSTNVAKGIARKQLTYTKAISEFHVKEQLIKMLTWYVGIQTNFQISIGAHGKYLEKYVEPDIWEKFRKTYVSADEREMWEALFLMLDIFDEVALKISKQFHYFYSQNEYQAVLNYLKYHSIF